MTKSKIGLILLVGLLLGCVEQNTETERARTIRLLTNDAVKQWVVNQTLTDGVDVPISFCDSSYVLTLRSDFTWNETFSRLSCYRSNDGSWSLNEENNVISINYISQISGNESENFFEIVELSEDYFAYELVMNNELRRVRLSFLKE